METESLDSEQSVSSGALGNTPIDEGGGESGGGDKLTDCHLMRATGNIENDCLSGVTDGSGTAGVVEVDDSIRTETSEVRQCVEGMELDDRDESMTEDADEGEEKQNGHFERASPPSSSSSSSSSWPRMTPKWLSRKRRQTDWDDNSTATPDGNEVGAAADMNVALSEEEDDEDQEMKKRRKNQGDVKDEGGGEIGSDAGDRENAGGGGAGDGAAVVEDENEGDGDDEEEEDSNDQYFDLFVSDSEDEESRNEWNRRRPAVFLRHRSDNDRHGNSDRNAQEVVTRRMRSEYKPANNRCSLLVQSSPARPLQTSSSSSPRSHNEKPEALEVQTCKRPPERCLLTLLRMREMGGRLGGRYGEVRWSSGSGFTRQVRRSSHMLRRLRRRSVLNVHSGCVNALNFSPVDGNLIASGSDDQQIAITDWMREKIVTKFDSGHEMNVFQTRFLFESQNLLMASCARDGMVRLSQMNSSGDLVHSKLLFHHNDSCNKVAVHPHEPHTLISSGEDSLIVHMDIREPDTENRYFQAYDMKRSSTVPLYSIHMHPLKSYEFCVCGRNPSIRVYDRRKVSWSSVGARLSTSRSDLTHDYNEPVQSFCAFSEMPDGQGKEKELWDSHEEVEGPLEVEEQEPEEETESEVRRRESEDKVDEAASGSPDQDEDKEPASDSTYLVNLHVTSAVYSNNGDAILSSYNDADIFLFDTKPGREDRPSHKYCGHRNNTTVKCVNFYGPDSEYIVSGSDCGNIFFWSRVSEEIANFQPGDNLGVVNALEPHPTLPVLATSGLDSNIKIWTPDWNDELEEVSSKRWPFEEKALGRTVLENWMDRESAKRMLIGQSTLLRMLRIALERTSRPRGSMDAGDGDLSDDDGEDEREMGPGRDEDSDSDSDGEGRRRLRRRDFCVQS